MTQNIFKSFIHFMLKRPCINCGIAPKMPWFLLCSSCLNSIAPIDKEHRCPYCLGMLTDAQKCFDCTYIGFKWNHFDALWDYNSIIAQLFLKYKFEGSLASENDLVRLLAPKIEPLKTSGIIPLLLPCGKETWQRLGFHPLERLLKRCGITPIVAFQKGTGPAQKSLSADKRRARKNFLTLKKGFIPSKNVLLMDDIVTTGATCHEGVRLLFDAGAETINIFALFRN